MHEWWARLFFRSRMRAELTREMAAHLEAKTAALLEEGLSPKRQRGARESSLGTRRYWLSVARRFGAGRGWSPPGPI